MKWDYEGLLIKVSYCRRDDDDLIEGFGSEYLESPQWNRCTA